MARFVGLHLLVGQERFLADGTLEGLLRLGVHHHVLLKGVPTSEVSAALGTGKQRLLAAFVSPQVSREGCLVEVVCIAKVARERPARMHATVPCQA